MQKSEGKSTYFRACVRCSFACLQNYVSGHALTDKNTGIYKPSAAPDPGYSAPRVQERDRGRDRDGERDDRDRAVRNTMEVPSLVSDRATPRISKVYQHMNMAYL